MLRNEYRTCFAGFASPEHICDSNYGFVVTVRPTGKTVSLSLREICKPNGSSVAGLGVVALESSRWAYYVSRCLECFACLQA